MTNLLARIYSDKRTIYILIATIVGSLAVLGMFFLLFAYSTVQLETVRDINIGREILVQIIAYGIGFAGLLVTFFFNYSLYKRFIYLICIGTIGSLLLLVTPLGIEANDAVRWLDLGIIQFQPSEILKITSIMFFAYIFSNEEILSDYKNLALYSVTGFLTIIITGLLQPDIGTTIVILAGVFSLCIISNLPRWWWKSALGVFILLFLILSFFWNIFVNTYVFDRLNIFYKIHFGELTTELIYGDAYHALQNIEAVQVGGLFGQSFGSLSSISNIYVPELTTDSIFAVVAAEGGFIISLFIIFLFLFLFLTFYYIADIVKDRFGKYLVIGLTTILATQFFVHILVVLGLPATGITLIFFSKGGSSILMTLVTIGIILSVLKSNYIVRRRGI